MGLLLSVLIVCVGVFEALDCFYHFRAGLLPPARGQGATSGWRQQLTNFNERWRRKPSALTCGGGGGSDGGGAVGGGDDQRILGGASSSATKRTLEENGVSRNGHCSANGHSVGAALSHSDHSDSESKSNGLNEHPRNQSNGVSPGRKKQISFNVQSGTSSLDRPVTLSLGATLDDPSTLEPFQDIPRRLSEAFPEIDDLPTPTTELLRVEVDLPRRLSEIEAEVPSPLPLQNADLPRRLSENLSDLPPMSPTKKSKVDISWPSHPPQHVLRSSARLEEVMSVDVESDEVHHSLTDPPLEEEEVFLNEDEGPTPMPALVPRAPGPFRSRTPSSPVDEIPTSGIEYHELQELLEILEKYGNNDAAAMSFWNTKKKRESDPQPENLPSVENPSVQYIELQDFLQQRNVEPDAPSKMEETQYDSEYDGPQVAQEPLPPQVADASVRKPWSGPAVPEQAVPSKEYMELQNFLNVLKAQEAHPSDSILNKYFADEVKKELACRQVPSSNLAKQSDRFKEYRELQSFLISQRGQEPPPPHSQLEVDPPPRGRTLSSGMVHESTECYDLAQGSQTFQSGQAIASTQDEHLGRARSHSFEDASTEVSESVIRATLEASARAQDETDVEDEEVAAISRLAELKNDVVELAKIDEKKHDIEDKIKATEGSQTPASRSESSGTRSPPTPPTPVRRKSPEPRAPEAAGAGPSNADDAKKPEPGAFWLIFSGEYTKAMSKDWHSGHFCCWQCDESLTGQRYVLRDDHPYCIKCYESVFANACEECNKTIGIDSKDLSYKDKHWHEACFLCSKCRVSLVDKQFGSKADHIYCGNCYDAQFASRCDGCGEIFRAGTKKMEYKTRQWHEKCFCCVVCKTAIGTKSFIPREQEIYCATCYEEKFATRCVKCNKIITSGGVTYKNEPWHRECFTCTHCNTSLAGQRFTSRDEKPYCAECFGELFAKRCTACTKPITGIGGTRFISFEDRHWHNDCFICASCKTSLVGRGFITDADDIICPECAKQKLM